MKVTRIEKTSVKSFKTIGLCGMKESKKKKKKELRMPSEQSGGVNP